MPDENGEKFQIVEPKPIESIPAPIYRNRKPIIIAGIIGAVVLVGGGSAFAYVAINKNKTVAVIATPSPSASPVVTAVVQAPIVTPSVAPTPVPTTKPTATTAPTPKPTSAPTPIPTATPVSTSTFLDSSEEYTFQYTPGLAISTTGTLTTITDPASNPTGNMFMPGTVMVSSNAYYTGEATLYPGVTLSNTPEVKSHADQVLDMVKGFSTSYAPITIGGMSGYTFSVDSEDGKSFNAELAGTRQIFQITCVGATSFDALTASQKLVFNSVRESGNVRP